ncbi:MAG: 16S rRNA (guanine(527)-N(7))-methyltransferase RsmG [bacterium]|nr:16S rRNA (guanine(527)-N(7))-methyltransferase RsmG [bacterium]
MSKNTHDLLTPLRELYSLNNKQLTQIQQLSEFTRYVNRHHNLLSRTNVENLWITLAIDSMAAVPYLPNSGRVLDVGSGNGMPGLLLAIARPDLSFTLAEAVNKKARMLEELRTEVGLANVVVWPNTVQSLPSEPYTVITARAVAPLPTLWRWTSRLRTVGTRYLLFRGSNELQENATLPTGLDYVVCQKLHQVSLWVADVKQPSQSAE